MRQPKIVARLAGGLGNQLFLYAAARRMALANDAELVLDDVSGFVRDQKYGRKYQLDHFHIPCRKATFTERLEPFSRIRRYLKRTISQLRPFDRRRYIQQEGIDFDPRLLHVRPSGTVHLEGYWQSERYFADVEKIIRQDLRLRRPRDARNQALADQIRETLSVAVHMRFFDDPPVSVSANASPDYYKRAIAAMMRRKPGAHYYLFSDQPREARALVGLPDDMLTVVGHNRGDAHAYADLWLMTLCNHFIIANSTFSWWGAWLGHHPAKVVVAPGFEVRKERLAWGFEGLLPRKWIKV